MFFPPNLAGSDYSLPPTQLRDIVVDPDAWDKNGFIGAFAKVLMHFSEETHHQSSLSG